MFEQRKRAAMETASDVKQWEAKRRANKLKFRQEAAKSKDVSKRIESCARLSRKQLQDQKQKQADEVREHKKQVLNLYRYQQEERAALVKQLVNSSVAKKFASPENSRRMLQHPHVSLCRERGFPPACTLFLPALLLSNAFTFAMVQFQEVTAVVTDVTSQISKEIAASPRRRPLQGALRITARK